MQVARVDSASHEAIRAAERRRISRELHDSTSQLLVVLQLQLGQLRNLPTSQTAGPLLDQLTETLQSLQASIKQVALESMDDRGFEDRQIQTAKVFLSLARTGGVSP